MSERRKDAFWILLLLSMAAASAALSLKVIARSRAPEPAPAAAAPRRNVFQGERRAVEVEAGLARRELGVERGSSLEMVSRYSAAAPARPPVPAARARAPAAEPAAGDDELSARERELLAEAAGRWDEGRAAELGSARGLMFKVGGRLLRHPKLLRWLLDRPAVASGIASQSRVRRLCSDAGALERYLVDKNDPGGIRLALAQLRNSLSYPGATGAAFGSRTMSQLILGCPSLKAVTKDPMRVGQIAVENQEFLPLLTDQRLISAVSESPLVMEVYQDIQSSRSRRP